MVFLNKTIVMGVFVYKRVSFFLTDFFVKNNFIPKEKKDIYTYGFELLTSSVVYALIFLFCALITSTLYVSIIFFLGFYLVRKFCGGYHANTYVKCNLISIFSHLIAIALILWFPNSHIPLFNILTLFVCAFIILLFAPVDHKNKRFIKNEYRIFKIKSCIYSCIILILAVLNTIRIPLTVTFDKYIFAYSIGTLSATISMICARIVNFKERRKST